jgi:uncharacterized protein
MRMIQKTRQAMVLVAGLLACLPARAIDCRRAVEDPARLICQSRRLLAADQGLNRVYAAALAHASHPGEVERSQRAWISGVQSRCTTEACLAKAYAVRIGQLAESYAPWCEARRGGLQHDWRGDGDAFFEELSIGAGSFSSWLHQRPETSGSWSAQGCSLVLHAQPEGLEFRWILLDLGPRRLRVFDLDDQDVAVYTRSGGP